MEGSNEPKDVTRASLPATVTVDSASGQRITRSTARAQNPETTTNTLTQPARVVILTASQAAARRSGPGNPGQMVQGAIPARTIVLQPPSKIPAASTVDSSQSGTISVTTLANQQSGTQIIIPSSTDNHQSVPENVAQTITVTVTEAERHGEGGIYPAGLQYVSEGTQGFGFATGPGGGGSGCGGGHQTPHGPLATMDQPASYTVYGEAAYSPYYTSTSYAQNLHSPGSGGATPGATYIISPGGSVQTSQPSPNTVDDDGAQHLSHTTRASPATIQWLLQNYETAEGVSLPRCTLYNHYLRHCAENKLDPVNAASFGKLIRSVFLGLRTRRLGTRGNSKYHYYGIRIKPDSPLNRISEDNIPMAMRQQPTHPNRRAKTITTRPEFSPHQQSTQQISSPNNACSYNTRSNVSTPTTPASGTAYEATVGPPSTLGNGGTGSSQPESHKQYLGQGYVPEITAPAPDYLQRAIEPLGLSVQQVIKLFRSYRQHCEDILDNIRKLQFQDVEHCWSNFWQPDDDVDTEEEETLQTRSGLTQLQLFSLCTVPEIQEYIENMDFRFYQVLVDVLIPNVLKPIPSSLTQAIRNFAKGLESGLKMAMQGAPDGIQKIKLNAVNSLAQTLRRYTSLNHLAQAARAVLQNPGQITQMLSDLNRVDFRNVQEQASWVCRCDPMLVEQIEKDFKTTLGKQKSLEQWAQWLEAVVDQVLAGCHDKPLSEMAALAKQFLLKWSFYSSMIIRDLTLRSAASFGSFHLIRLLYDEYMFYLVEQRLAKSVDQTSIAIMAQSGHCLMDAQDYEFALEHVQESGMFSAQVNYQDPMSNPESEDPLSLSQPPTGETSESHLFVNGDSDGDGVLGTEGIDFATNESENARPPYNGKRPAKPEMQSALEAKHMKIGPQIN